MHAAERTSRHSLRHGTKSRKSDPFSTASTPAGGTVKRDKFAVPDREQVRDLPFSEDLIKTALNSALSSPEFQSAPQLRAFLEFVVRAALSNNLEKIKGYTIAVEALGRPEDFNPVTDPIVRVEAARLRRRLTKYYETSGASDAVRITIPKGSYAPQFSAQEPKIVSETSVSSSSASQFKLDSKSLHLETSGAQTDPPPEIVTGIKSTFEAMPTADPAVTEPSPESELLHQQKWHNPGARDPETRLQRLTRQRLSVSLTMIIGAACFLVGYLIGAL